MYMPKYLAFIGSTVFALAVMPNLASAEVVGTMTALQTQIAGNNGKNLSVGSKISLGDSLSSNKTGLGMIVFADESSAKIGPNSKLVIDEFVYQPGRNRGKVAVNMNSGLVRFYGGQISKSGKMQVTTPHIVLGIRGGILDTRVTRAFTKSILRAGRMSCSVNGKTRIITKPGFACISDGKTLKIEMSKDDDMDLLDSRDMVAGNGIPGRKGQGLRARANCIDGSKDATGFCKSSNGSLPGLTGDPERRNNPIIPLGSQKQQEVIIVENPTPVVNPTLTQTTPAAIAAATDPAITGTTATACPTAPPIPAACL